MENWNVGDIAICVNSKPTTNGVKTPLREGSEYIVKGIKEWTCCNRISLDVGISSPGTGSKCTCHNINTYDGIFWFHTERFVKKQTLHNSSKAEFKQVTYTKIIQDIPMPVN